MLASVSAYVRSIIDGLPILYVENMPPLTAWITPPALEQADGPRAHVWGGAVDITRQTAPRGPGFKKWPWVIDVYLVYLTTPDDGLDAEPMPRIIDAVITQFAATTMPLFIDVYGNPMGPNAVNETDTQIQGIGERIRLQYPTEKMAGPMQMLWYTSLLSVDVLEVVQS
jgi:hypothetical protein